MNLTLNLPSLLSLDGHEPSYRCLIHDLEWVIWGPKQVSCQLKPSRLPAPSGIWARLSPIIMINGRVAENAHLRDIWLKIIPVPTNKTHPMIQFHGRQQTQLDCRQIPTLTHNNAGRSLGQVRSRKQPYLKWGSWELINTKISSENLIMKWLIS